MNKKLILPVVLMFSLLGVVSCEEEDDTAYVAPNYIAGRWSLAEVGTLNGQNVLNYEPLADNDCDAEEIIFNEDYTFDTTTSQFEDTNCVTVSREGTYAFAPGNVIFNYSNAASSADTLMVSLRTLTDREMVLVTNDENNAIQFLKYAKVNE